MEWAYLRDRWMQAAAAVCDAEHNEGLAGLGKHPTVIAALAQIDMAERAIASIADEMLVKYHDEPEEV